MRRGAKGRHGQIQASARAASGNKHNRLNCWHLVAATSALVTVCVLGSKYSSFIQSKAFLSDTKTVESSNVAAAEEHLQRTSSAMASFSEAKDALLATQVSILMNANQKDSLRDQAHTAGSEIGMPDSSTEKLTMAERERTVGPEQTEPKVLSIEDQHKLILQQTPPCEYILRDVVASRPGAPCVPPAKKYPWSTRTQWRIDLGERIIKAAVGRVTEKQCGGWKLYGDATYCLKVFNARKQGNKEILAFSYGIEERDEWSEKMGSLFGVPSHLYDCFIEPEKSPPMNKSAPNGTSCAKDQAHCYKMPYWSHRVCLGAEAGRIDGRSYETLTSHLRDRGPLSTHLKIDVEGSEWTVLEDLLNRDEDIAKIRSLDMEVHFGYSSASEAKYSSLPEEERIARQVKIFEGLAEKLVVTGTTIETYRQGWWPDKDCPKQNCHEPVVHLAGGWSPQMFAISYVNRALVGVEKSTSSSLAEIPATPQHKDSFADGRGASSGEGLGLSTEGLDPRPSGGSKDRKYLMGDVGSNDCPPGSGPLEGSEECEQAALILGKKHKNGPEEPSEIDPAGCVYRVPDQDVYFNPHEDGDAHSARQLICREGAPTVPPRVRVKKADNPDLSEEPVLEDSTLQAQHKVILEETPPCEYIFRDVVASRPGVPCVPPAKIYPWSTRTQWRIDLGERILKAAAGRVTEEQCGGWKLYGDATYCLKVFNGRKEGNKDILAFSYGIEERDEWSEKMGSLYGVPSHLYDCFIEPEKSPPINKSAPNGTYCAKDQTHCYTMPYWSYRICLGAEAGNIDGRSYETLASHLRERGPLSTHLKIDVEGSEWTVLEDLLKRDEDIAKIRSLDMEVHFGYNSASEAKYSSLPEEERIARQVKIFEGLAEKLVVTGTTIETYRQGWWPDKDCPKQNCHEPVVHLAGGWSPQMFAISYVNRQLVGATLI
eukprot:TRINITY_DN2245_c0_g1_i1.p1 TRINITY_DN2245_c0_g1~~TRINITY_DN2245_c0_g1_i1.p1  ORF type:complete len:938 (-),score=132.13 TRINITY_DN2245_c0_g1_i1:87-2900(-)